MSNIEHMVNRFLAWKLPVDFYPDGGISFNREGRNHAGYQHEWPVGTNLLTAEQAKAMFEYVLDGAQQPQYEAGDVASASAQGFRDGVASVTQQPQKLEDVEQYRMQMAGISTAAMGYWKEGDSIHPDYDTLALRDVAKLYAKYDALYKAQQPQADTPQATTIAEAARDVGKWLNERPNRPIDLRHVAMLVAHAMQPQAEAVQQKPKLIGWRTSDYLMETSDKDKADNWAVHNEILPIFEGDPYTKLVASTQQVQATHQHDLARRLRVHLANRHTLTGKEFADGVEATLAEYYAAPQQAEAAPPDVVRDAERLAYIAANLYHDGYAWWTPDICVYESPEESQPPIDAVRQAIDAAIAQQKGQP